MSGANGMSWERFGDEALDGWVYGSFRKVLKISQYQDPEIILFRGCENVAGKLRRK